MSEQSPSFFRSRKFVLICLAIAIAYFVAREHWRHIVEILPYLVLLMCPLMHIFMHGGHGSHSGHEQQQAKGSCCAPGAVPEDAESAYRRGVEDGKRQLGH